MISCILTVMLWTIINDHGRVEMFPCHQSIDKVDLQCCVIIIKVPLASSHSDGSVSVFFCFSGPIKRLNGVK